MVVQDKHNTHGQNHGQTLKIQWFFSNGICNGHHLLASCGKDSSKKFYWVWKGESIEWGLFIENKDASCSC